MNNLFSLPRFRHVMAWDLTINKKFYTRQAMSIFTLVMIPLLLRYIVPLYKSLCGDASALQNMSAGETRFDLWTYSSFLDFTWGALSLLYFGYVFHNLLTRQSRIAELTLPATNLEKMISHLLITIVGSQVVFLLSVLMADLLHVILGWLIFHQRSFQSLSLCVFRVFDNMRLFGADGEFHGTEFSATLLSIFCFMLAVNFCATFVLGNAIKYRYNIVLTMLFHLAFNLLMVLAMGLCIPLIGNFDLAESLQNMPDWVGDVIMIGLDIVSVLVFCGICWLTYHCYTRAQITSKLNP